MVATTEQPTPIDATTLRAWLVDGAELAVLDAREQGVYFYSHLFHASCIPLSQLELMVGGLVPRRSTRVVWCDDGRDDLATRAGQRMIELGWTDVSLLVGGTAAWAEEGGELYSGVNVPSKAFGEHVEHAFDTPRVPAGELKQLLDDNANVVVLDSRPMNEFNRMSIPSGTDCPGAELVYRVKEVVDDPDTLVVVNCAGRTRSIIGAQSLINAGLENRVMALENGTMGWELAGFSTASGETVHAPEPGPDANAWSREAAAAVGERFGVRQLDSDEVTAWRADPTRTTYLLDVRTAEEFAAGHVDGSVHAPGGQLVQATDEYVGTRNARLVLIDNDGVRATMTASWLRQLGWADAVVWDGAFDDTPLVAGSVPRSRLGRSKGVSAMKVSELAARLDEDGLAVLDLGTSLKYRRRGHIPGAWWGVRSRLDQARAAIGSVSTLVLTDSDGQVSKLAVPEAEQLWPGAEVHALAGGNKGWRHGEQPMDEGFEHPTTDPDDVWYKPYDHDGDVAEQHMQDYLTWEIALVDQLARDETVSFPDFN